MKPADFDDYFDVTVALGSSRDVFSDGVRDTLS